MYNADSLNISTITQKFKEFFSKHNEKHSIPICNILYQCNISTKYSPHSTGWIIIVLTFYEQIAETNTKLITLISTFMTYHSLGFLSQTTIPVKSCGRVNGFHMSVKQLSSNIKTQISNLVFTTRFWNNLHQVRLKSIDWKSKQYKALGAIKPKSLNRITTV